MRLILALLVTALIAAASVLAADKVKPLDEILDGLKKDYPGRVLDTRLRGKEYEIRILTRSGEVVELVVDGESGEVEEEKTGEEAQ